MKKMVLCELQRLRLSITTTVSSAGILAKPFLPLTMLITHHHGNYANFFETVVSITLTDSAVSTVHPRPLLSGYPSHDDHAGYIPPWPLSSKCCLSSQN